jgi:transmembrane sensor
VPWLRETSAVATIAAHRETLALLDGSSAELNASTGVRTDFRYGRRIVHLDRGEAFFSVAKDAAHPFFVETPAGKVRVTGTKFNVRLEENGAAEVTLLEGTVVFERDDSSARRAELTPGQQFDSARVGVLTLTSSDLENVTAWRQGRLAFDGLTLAEVAARLSAFHGVHIDVDPAAAGFRPGGSFPVDNLPAILHALETALDVRVLLNGDGSYRIIAR